MVQVDQHVTPQVSHAQVGRSILRATGALMFVQVIIRGFGLIEKMILGRLFGTDYRTDAYNAAKDIAFNVYQMVDQVVMHSFLPVFVQRLRENGEKDAWRLASTVINLLMLLMAIVAVFGIFFAPDILHLYVPNWSEDHIQLTVKLMRTMLVAVIFLSTSSLTYCLLNSYKQFALPASADLALKGTVLVFALIFAKTWGPYALAAGFVFGAIAKVIVHGGGLRKQLLNYRPVVDIRHVGLKQFALLSLPLIISTLFSIFRGIMDTRFTSSLPEGSLSALKFARTLCDTPVQFFPFAFGIALFPFLADIAVAGDKQRLREMLMMATRMMILIFVPLATTIIALRDPLVLAVFGSKAMLTTVPLQIYAIGMLVGALEIIVLQFFFAMSDTLRPSIVGIAFIPVHIGASYFGVYHLHWGIIAIAAALLLSKGLKVIVLYVMMRKKLLSLEGKRTLALAGRVLAALVPLVGILLLANFFLPEPGHAAGKIKKALELIPYGLAGGFGIALYLTVLYWLRTEEVTMLIARLRGKLSKGRTPQPPMPAEGA